MRPREEDAAAIRRLMQHERATVRTRAIMAAVRRWPDAERRIRTLEAENRELRAAIQRVVEAGKVLAAAREGVATAAASERTALLEAAALVARTSEGD